MFERIPDPIDDQDLYINHEISWIAFNHRVLAQALDEHTPLLEQGQEDTG